MKKTLLLLATLACAAALYLGYQYSKTLTPETVLQELFDMNAPARYAFISDADAPKLAVIDLETSRQTSLLDLKQPARNLTIHKTLGLLAYNDGGTTVTIRQLGDHSEKNHTLAHPVTRLQFDADSPWLIAGGADRLTLLNSQSGETRTLDGYQHISAWLYSPLARQIWILDDSPALYRYRLTDNSQTRHPLPDGWHDLTAAAISPDEQNLLFGATTASGEHLGINWSTETASIAQQIPLTAPLVQPYIDNNGQLYIYIDRNGNGHLVPRNQPDAVQTIRAPNPTDRYATGWLDTRLIAVGNRLKTWDISDPDKAEEQDEQALPAATRALFITADSKTALIASDGQAAITAYDLRDGGLQTIALSGITRPQNLIMGAGNTLCH